jgi:uncharacterized surface protein with fasciclin (FAS1) repeats
MLGKLIVKQLLLPLKQEKESSFDNCSRRKLTASMKGENVIVTDDKGGVATVTAVDLNASNGVIHVVDSVLMHK